MSIKLELAIVCILAVNISLFVCTKIAEQNNNGIVNFDDVFEINDSLTANINNN